MPINAAPPQNLRIIGKLLSADMNTTADQLITLTDYDGPFILDRVLVYNPSISLTTAVGGHYLGAGKTTVLTSAATAYSQLTDATKYLSIGASGVGTTTIISQNFIYLALSTPQGVAATCDMYVWGRTNIF